MKNFFYPGIISVFIFLSCGTFLRAQTAAEAMTHPVILKYYTPAQLMNMEQNDTAQLAGIIYYYTNSFIVVPVQCYDCLPFDSLNFDITRFEYLRKTEDPYSRSFDKYGFSITIVPLNAMAYPVIHGVPLISPAENPQTH